MLNMKWINKIFSVDGNKSDFELLYYACMDSGYLVIQQGVYILSYLSVEKIKLSTV